MSKVLKYAGEKNVEKLLEAAVRSEGVSVVDFFATWCGPCRALLPVLDEVSEEVDYNITKVDVDEYKELAAFYGVRSIPTLVVFKDGKIVDTLIGGRDKDTFKAEIAKYL